MSVDTIKKTFENTTQYARNFYKLPLRRHFKSRFPALNVKRRNEAVATDTIWADVPAFQDGSKCAQLFVGRESLVTDCYGMKTDGEFGNTLEDNIRRRGAMDKLISDRAQSEVSKKVHDILRAYRIEDWQSEPHQQNQNYAERRIQDVKTTTNRIMDRTGAPACMWLLCILYVCYLVNRTWNETIGAIPLRKLSGHTPDISALMQFAFWDKVYFAVDNKFPSELPEEHAHVVGIAEHVGDALTYILFNPKTDRLIYRSAVRPATGPKNLRLASLGGETATKPVVHTRTENYGSPSDYHAKSFDPDELIGRIYLKDPTDEGERFRARISRKIIEHDENNQELIKFLVTVDQATQDEILSYGELLDIIERQHQEEMDDTERMWTFKGITAHEGPLSRTHPSYNGCEYNIMVQWENGTITTEPQNVIAADDPVTCAMYAKTNGLLDTPGWKRFKRLATREKKMLRMVNQARMKSVRRAPIYQFGLRIPRSTQDAYALDKENGNAYWTTAMKLELAQLDDYDVFEDKGLGPSNLPKEYQRIRVHFVFAVKHDGRHKARLVAGGHLTQIPTESVYSGVVSLRSLRLVVFLAELNGLDLMQADIGNAYLEAYTKEKVFFIAGPEFGELEGHVLVIRKALYGLRSSGARFHEKLADSL